MPDWFWQTLEQVAPVLVGTLAFFLIVTIIGSAGYQAKRGSFYASWRQWKSAVLRWSYALFVSIAAIAGGVWIQMPWYFWLGVVAVWGAGFFGCFLVPGP